MSIYTTLWGIKESVKKDIRDIGDKLQLLTPIAFIVWCACFGDNHAAIVFTCTFVTAIVLMSLIKAVFNAPRPCEVEGDVNPDLRVDWSPSEGNSFVSGHTISAMVGAMFWFQIDPIVGVVGLVLAVITGLSRIIAKAHWLRDVIGSTILAAILYGVAVIWFL